MSNIKELTWEHHKKAERCGFVKVLLSGEINPELYATFLWNQYLKYTELEELADKYNLLDGIETVKRKDFILSDFLELWKQKQNPITFESTNDYISHIRQIRNKQHIFAHVYVHHMGDLSGGQLISKRVPGQCKMYKFMCDTQELKDQIRARTTDKMSDEASICFQYAIKTFEEIEQLEMPLYNR